MAAETREPKSGAVASMAWLVAGVGLVGLTLMDQRGLVFPYAGAAPTALIAIDQPAGGSGQWVALPGGTDGAFGRRPGRRGGTRIVSGPLVGVPRAPVPGGVTTTPASPFENFASNDGIGGGLDDGPIGGGGAPGGFQPIGGGSIGGGGFGGGGGGGGVPIDPDTPVTPTPETPTQPNPDQPTIPGQPTNPDQPTTPGQPTNPDQPTTPGEPTPNPPVGPNPPVDPNPGPPVVSPVPEPAAWGLMIGGVALIGGALRRRRVSSARGCLQRS